VLEWLRGASYGKLKLNQSWERSLSVSEKKHLYVLWTNDNLITAEKMVFMYTVNSLVRGWWEKVTLHHLGRDCKIGG